MHTSVLATVPLIACVLSAPYALKADKTVSPAVHASYGNKDGNFQPTSTVNKESPDTTGETVTGGAAVTTINNQDGIGAGTDTYITYSGDGSLQAGWPTLQQWVSFEDMFNNNKVIMNSSCENMEYPQANDSGPEIGAIYNSIQQVAAETNVDHRFILAVMMQESGGCVREVTSNYGVRNPGLMQDHNGAGTCNSDITGQVQNPCPTGVITEMIQEGTAGTSDGDGLANCINEATAQFDVTRSRAFYIAARIYNSGSVDPSGNLEAGIATHCYSSDIANRLTGWVSANSNCPYDN